MHPELGILLHNLPHRIAVPIVMVLGTFTVFTKTYLLMFDLCPSAETTRVIQSTAGVLTIIVASGTIFSWGVKYYKRKTKK